ncbi:hypothetical protein CH354_02960 [Leptospira levettii]|nr:hypothetical protein CH354_02960 [Leptospira levettii]PJZ89302.1 hypothetical protein CH368_07385 [Leptospira levettii]PKA01039.1 hypothetical protein CH369_04365 [Leptospira levettii]
MGEPCKANPVIHPLINFPLQRIYFLKKWFGRLAFAWPSMAKALARIHPWMLCGARTIFSKRNRTSFGKLG